MATAIVTGATGLVGFNTVTTLLTKQYEVYALGRNLLKLSELEKLGAHTVQLDITTDISEWGNTLPQHAYWFHCAAAVSGSTQQQLIAVNVDGTNKILQKFFALKGKYFIHISTISVYSLDLGIPLHENANKQPTSIYGQSKLLAEQVVTNAFSEHHSTSFSILRPPFICGPKDQNFVYELAVRLHKRSPLLISRDSLVGIIDARDLAKIMIEASNNPEFAGEVVNVQGHVISFHKIVKLIASVTKLPEPRTPLPYPLAMLLALINELVKKIRRQNADKGLSRYRIRSLTTNRYLATDKLTSLLKFKAIPLEQSLSDWWQNCKL